MILGRIKNVVIKDAGNKSRLKEPTEKEYRI